MARIIKGFRLSAIKVSVVAGVSPITFLKTFSKERDSFNPVIKILARNMKRLKLKSVGLVLFALFECVKFLRFSSDKIEYRISFMSLKAFSLKLT